MRLGCGLLVVLLVLGPLALGMSFNVDTPLSEDGSFTWYVNEDISKDHGTRGPPAGVPTFVNLYFHRSGNTMNTSNIAYFPPTSFQGPGSINFTLQDPLIGELLVEDPIGNYGMMAQVYLSGTGWLTASVYDNDENTLIGSGTHGDPINRFEYGVPTVVDVPIPFEPVWGHDYTFGVDHYIVFELDFELSAGHLHYDSLGRISSLGLYCTPVINITIGTHNFYGENEDTFYPRNIEILDDRTQVQAKGVVTDVFGKRDKKYIQNAQVQIEGPGGMDQTWDASWNRNTNEYSYSWKYSRDQPPSSGKYNVTAHIFDEQDNEFTVKTNFTMADYGVLLTSPSQVGGEGSYPLEESKAKRNVVQNNITRYHINVWNIGNLETGVNITTAGSSGWDWWLEGENLTNEYQKYGEIASLDPGEKKGIKLCVDAMNNPPSSVCTITVTAASSQEPSEVTMLTAITIVVPDIESPVILDVTATPSLQEVHNHVNISAEVIDDGKVYGVWVNITEPAVGTIGNYSMIYDAIKPWYYYNSTYSILGTFKFTIWTNDTANNWNSSTAQFTIQDETPPSISSITVSPTPQEIYKSANISVLAADNYDLFGVWVNITDPIGETIGNFSMVYDTINDKHYYNSSYSMLGTFACTIWANDTSNNWNSTQSTPSQFVVHDKTLPTITHQASPSPQEIEEKVNITAIITDNVNVEEVWVQILEPDDSELENVTMIRTGSTDNYWYNRTYSAPGNYEYTIWAKDSTNNWAYAEGSFVTQDTIPPIANAGSDREVEQGTTVTYNGSSSLDSDRIDNYTWSFNYNGETVTLYGINPSFKFEIVGNFSVMLRVIDPSGNLAYDTMWINVTGEDSDNDGLTDYDEENIYDTNPDNPDSDGDGVNDGDEITKGTDPLKSDKAEKPEKSFFERYWWIFPIIATIAVLLVLLFLLSYPKKERK